MLRLAALLCKTQQAAINRMSFKHFLEVPLLFYQQLFHELNVVDVEHKS